MEIMENVKSALEFSWMVFFSIIYFIGNSIIVWLVITISYNRKYPERGEPFKFWRFVKVYLLFPLYAILLFLNVLRNLFRGNFDSFMTIFVLLIFQNVDELILLYGGKREWLGILMLSAFILLSLIAHLSLRQDAIKAKQELLAEQESEQISEEPNQTQEEDK